MCPGLILSSGLNFSLSMQIVGSGGDGSSNWATAPCVDPVSAPRSGPATATVGTCGSDVTEEALYLPGYVFLPLK